MVGGKDEVKKLYLVSNIIISDFKKAMIEHEIDYQIIRKDAPKYQTYIVTDVSSDVLLKAMPEQYTKGRVPMISYEEAQDYTITTNTIIKYRTCFLQIDVSECQHIVGDC